MESTPINLIRRGVYRGGALSHGPPLGHQDSTISIEYYAKLRHAPPPPPPLCNLGRRFEHTNGRRRPKTGLNLGEDLFFFFWSSPNFGPKTGLILSEDLFLGLFWTGKTDWFWVEKFSFLSLLFSNFLNFLAPLLSKILCTLLLIRLPCLQIYPHYDFAFSPRLIPAMLIFDFH